MKYRILTLIFLICWGFAYAQDEEGDSSLEITDVEGVTPEAGDLSFSLNLGRSQYLGTPGLPSSPGAQGYWTVYPGYAQVQQIEVSNSITNMIGAEIRYFVTNRIAAKINGGAILRANPYRTNEPTEYDVNSGNATWIPAYASVIGKKTTNISVTLGAEYQARTRYANLIPYYGVSFPFYYSKRSEYDPAIFTRSVYVGGQYVEQAYNQDIGWRHGEQVGFGIQAVGGFDYYLMDGMFIGFEAKPISFIYSFQTVAPGSGLPSLQTESTNWGFLTQPVFKLGFRF